MAAGERRAIKGLLFFKMVDIEVYVDPGSIGLM